MVQTIYRPAFATQCKYKLLQFICHFMNQLEYLAEYGRASMGVPVGELQYGTVLDGHVRP